MENEHYECIEIPPTAYGFEIGGRYRKSNYRFGLGEEGKMYLFNKRGNKQIVEIKHFKLLD